MKNAMKKLMSLVLVAMILVSAVPFAASATETETTVPTTAVEETQAKTVAAENNETVASETAEAAEDVKSENETVAEAPTDANVTENNDTVDADVKAEVSPIKVVVKSDSSDNVIWSGEKVPSNKKSATVENLLTYCFNKDWKNIYTFDHAWSSNQKKNVSLSDKIEVGDTLSVMLKEKKNNDNTFDAGTEETKNELNGYTKFHEDVYLYIYADTTVGTVKKSIKITDGIAADGKVTMNEVKSVVKQYFNAIDADTGITYDGLYPVQGNWVADYVADKKYDTIDGLYEAAAKQTVIIRVMVGNAKLASSSSSNADSSNPKTGDEIYMAVTAMAVSASALALGFYFLKKRAI